MKIDGDKVVNDVQSYLMRGVIPHPCLYFTFLAELYRLSKRRKVCMTPLALLEYYNLRIDNQMTQIIERRQQVRKQRKVA
jgi:hypothetical protein